jgi:rRNA maturation RNase YbeY
LDEIKVIFCTDDYLLRINKEFLQHDTLTDIITFPFSRPGEPLLSDIYISVERVRENAGIFGKPFLEELHRVIFHGLLHLCGYKDKTTPQQKVMRGKEGEYLERYRSTWNF